MTTELQHQLMDMERLIKHEQKIMLSIGMLKNRSEHNIVKYTKELEGIKVRLYQTCVDPVEYDQLENDILLAGYTVE